MPWVVMVTELSERLDSELREVKVTHQQLKEQNDDLRHKMSFFIRASRVNVSVFSLSLCSCRRTLWTGVRLKRL